MLPLAKILVLNTRFFMLTLNQFNKNSMKKISKIVGIAFFSLLLSACLKENLPKGNPEKNVIIPEEKTQTIEKMQGTKDCQKFECGTSSIQNLAECDLANFGMTCDLVKLLEENLAWTVYKNGVDFCAYESLNKEGTPLYLQVLCQEFYLQDQEIVCPDRDSREECFITKDENRTVCQEKCEIKEVTPYLVNGGGVSIPVKIIEEDDGRFTIWEPRDGSFYMKDLQEYFPAEILENLENVDGATLGNRNIERAEKYFNTKIHFEVAGELETECQKSSDCGDLPSEYALKSNCPHRLKCLENQCVAGCYDFSDNYELPILKQYTWEDAVDFIQQGVVEKVFQSHALDVELYLKNGIKIDIVEPTIDAVFKEIKKCGTLCEDVVMGTE